MKYIDADKLKEEVERRREFHDNAIISLCNSQTIRLIHSAGLKEDEEVLSLIDSLEQEQPKQKKNCNDCPHCVDRKDQFGWHFKGCFGGPYNGKFIAEIDECPLQQEQPEMDLDELINDFLLDNYEFLIESDSKAVVQKLAHHFYELGLNAGKV